LIELLFAISLLAVGLLALAPMFSTGYSDVSAGGRRSLGLAATRQLLEDVRALPFERIDDLANFRTDVPASLVPVNAALDPGRTMVREVARKWVYSLAGDQPAWAFTVAEKARWETLSIMGNTPSGAGTVVVETVSPTIRRVTVSVTLPGQFGGVTLATLIARL
jgi:hypothetical protein